MDFYLRKKCADFMNTGVFLLSHLYTLVQIVYKFDEHIV
jgi:hypothetical protein